MTPTLIDVQRRRGDTYPEYFTVASSEAGWTLAGATFLLTVDPSEDPSTNTANLFQVAGVIDSVPEAKIHFDISVLHANQLPDTYYYDIQMTDALGKITTIVRGKWQVIQDITK
jgi:hypothetical protein